MNQYRSYEMIHTVIGGNILREEVVEVNQSLRHYLISVFQHYLLATFHSSNTRRATMAASPAK